MKDFLDLASLSSDEIKSILSRAGELQRQPVSDELQGKNLGLLFFNPSLRTLASFQSGMAQLGGSSFVISPGQGTWNLETRSGVIMNGQAAEHVKEAIPVLEEYADALGIRCFAAGKDLAEDSAEPVLSALQDVAHKPMINLESAMRHPCQAIADWKTLDDLEVPTKGKFVLSWAQHPSPLPLAVPNSTLLMAARRGMNVTVLRPEGYALPADVMNQAHEYAKSSGSRVHETSEREEAMTGAHVLYAKSWRATADYGNARVEQELRSAAGDFTVDESWFDPAEPDSPFLHCLPVRRNVVVADAVLDGPRSRVVQQAGNRLHVQKAILCALLGRESS